MSTSQTTTVPGADLYEAAAVIPGRSLTRSKAPGKLWPVGTGPTHALHGEGCMVRYSTHEPPLIDMLCALGAVSVGYGKFAADHVGTGQVSSLPLRAEVEAAQKVLEKVAPWASHVRFLKTGSEATHAAYRIAKRATGRRHVLMGDWAYHGWHEWCERGPNGVPELPTTHTFPHGEDFAGDLHGEIDRVRPDEFAAVFVEPHRWEPVDEAWLRHVRAWCDRHGVLLVFDEMIYGGRVSMGGATETFGVQPDLACYGKAYGNGTPIAFVVGRDVLRDHGELASGTYSGDPLGLDAVLATLSTYPYTLERMWASGRQLQRGLRAVVAEHFPGAIVEGMPVHQRIRFGHDALGHRFSEEMLKRGVLWHPACANVMAAHHPEHIERVVVAAEQSLKAMAVLP